MKMSTAKIPLAITGDDVALGSHLIHFWNTEEEFERGVRFFEPAILDETQYCVLFGHDEANARVLQVLRMQGHEVDAMLRDGRLVVLRRESSAAMTLANIEAAFSAALQKGARIIRYLGNLGMGRDPLPARGVNDVIDLEKGATPLALRYPCVIVCMYDVNTVSGALLLNAGFGAHTHAVSGGALRENSYYMCEDANQVFCEI
jgi:hypothetical protein